MEILEESEGLAILSLVDLCEFGVNNAATRAKSDAELTRAVRPVTRIWGRG
jgi:hypothetical protein